MVVDSLTVISSNLDDNHRKILDAVFIASKNSIEQVYCLPRLTGSDVSLSQETAGHTVSLIAT